MEPPGFRTGVQGPDTCSSDHAAVRGDLQSVHLLGLLRRAVHRDLGPDLEASTI